MLQVGSLYNNDNGVCSSTRQNEAMNDSGHRLKRTPHELFHKVITYLWTLPVRSSTVPHHIK